jgi:hypothetical protein
MRWQAAAVLCAVIAGAGARTARADDVKLILPWLMINAVDEHEYIKAPGATPDRQTWTWHPKVQFSLREDAPSGASFVARFTAGGKPWVDVPCQNLNGTWTCQGTPPEKRSKDTGTFGLELRFKNALAGTDTAVYSGTFKVGKYFDGRAAYKNEDKNCFEYYVDHDWALPLGMVILWQGNAGEPLVLRAFLWFKWGYPQPNRDEVMGYLFKNGKEVCHGHGGDGEEYMSEQMDTDDGTKQITWTRRMFYLDDCKAKIQNPGMFPKAYALDKNPGEYELKVLVKGELARVARFTVKPDGTIDNPIGADNPQLNTGRAMMPVQVLKTLVPYDKDAWKAGVFYGNKLKGFSAP